MCQLPVCRQLPPYRQRVEEGGFTLLECMVAIAVLTIGLTASALLMSITFKNSVRSRYMAEAAQLASEKLEDLNRFPVSITSGVYYPDPHVFVPSGSTCNLSASTTGTSCVGSVAPALTCAGRGNCTQNAAAATQTIAVGDAGAGGTVSNIAATVSYSDSVFLSAANGTISETYETVGGSTPNYSTLSYSPTGTTPVPSNSSTAPTVGETFDRRWVIEQDAPLAGVRRITVLVTLMDETIWPPVTFQMSMVRP